MDPIKDSDIKQTIPTPEATQEDTKALRSISNILSAVFSPLLIPTYAFAMALWMTPLSMLPERGRFIICLTIFGITAVIPLGTIIFLMRKGVVSDAAISKPSERAIPYTTTIICYVLATLYLAFLGAPRWLWMFFIGACTAAIIDAIINIKWKISAHATSMGGLCAMVFYFGYSHIAIVTILPWISVVVVLSGLVGSARIYLGRHTQAQVYAGWAVGLIVTYCCIALL